MADRHADVHKDADAVEEEVEKSAPLPKDYEYSSDDFSIEPCDVSEFGVQRNVHETCAKRQRLAYCWLSNPFQEEMTADVQEHNTENAMTEEKRLTTSVKSQGQKIPRRWPAFLRFKLHLLRLRVVNRSFPAWRHRPSHIVCGRCILLPDNEGAPFLGPHLPVHATIIQGIQEKIDKA